MRYVMAMVMAVLFALPSVRIGCPLQFCTSTSPTTLLVSDGFGDVTRVINDPYEPVPYEEPIRVIDDPVQPVPLELPDPEPLDRDRPERSGLLG